METKIVGNHIFIRLDSGEELLKSLKKISTDNDIRVAAIVSGVGMADGVEMGFFCIPKDDYDRTKIAGIFDISSISGNITLMDNEPFPHVHMTLNDPNYKTYSGHILEARCHITMEIVILKLNDMPMCRQKFVGTPATRVSFSN